MKSTFIILAIAALAFAAFWGLKVSEPADTHDAYEGWSEATNGGITFKYPNPFHGTYISAAEWPPLVERVVNKYSCNTTITGTDGPVPHLEEKTINGTTYCVSTSSEGAAGSTYITYEYAREGIRGVFTFRFPQCLNYDEPEQGACKLEQQTFDIDTLADRILSSVR